MFVIPGNYKLEDTLGAYRTNGLAKSVREPVTKHKVDGMHLRNDS